MFVSSSGSLLLKRLINSFVKPYFKELSFAVMAMIIVALSNSFHVLLVKPALDKIFVKLDKEMLLIIPIAMVAVGLIKALATFFQNYYMSMCYIYQSNVAYQFLVNKQNYRLLMSSLETSI